MDKKNKFMLTQLDIFELKVEMCKSAFGIYNRDESVFIKQLINLKNRDTTSSRLCIGYLEIISHPLTRFILN